MDNINTELYFQFFMVCTALAFTPGAAILLAVKNTLLYGYKATFYSSIGNTIVVTSYSMLASIASVYTMNLDAETLNIVRYLGAGYLSYIAIRLMFKKVDLSYQITTKKQKLGLVIEGFLNALSNPKMVVFYIVLWSSFIDTSLPLMPQSFAMSLTLVAWSILSLIGTATLVTIGKKKYINETNLGKVNKVMAIAFLTVAYFIVN